MVTGTLLAAEKVIDFYVLDITLTPPTFKRNATVACRNFLCVTHSAAATEVSSLNVTMRYVKISSTFPDKPSLITLHE